MIKLTQVSCSIGQLKPLALLADSHCSEQMKGSRLQEWTPKRKYAVVEWQKSYRTRKVVGKWVERPMISQSVPATPTKSASKQPSHDMLHHGGDDFLGGLDDHRVIPLHLPKSLSQNDYIRQWVPKTKAYLDILLEREVPSDRSCIICGTDGVYKCHGCFSEPLYCTSCCRTQHQRLPFHRVSQWTGSFFEESCLVKSGIVIWLGHNGNPWEEEANTTDMESSEDEDGGDPSSKRADDLPTGVPFVKGNSALTTIVDKSGMHTHLVKYCTCPNAAAADIQMFQMGLFPASFLESKTAFTFDVLNDFLLDNLECGTSAMNYYSKLRRMTTTVFPHLVPDRYRELMRVTRQWRKLKLLKRNGFGHEEKDVRPGDLALFCPACPQPGINTPSWLYTRSLIMDGNFKAEHLHPVHPGNEVSLMDGHGFMVGDALYKEHLAANASHHKLEATGIGGCACARHGCFVPHAMVDFQKGERQMNMDYALCEVLKINADGIRRALTFYDVNCQYHKRLKDRIAKSPILQIPKELDIIPGIGLWHVHGHQDSCYVRYASNFIEGATRIDGEIMETLWAPLNIISPAARGMGTPHRKECLDYQMNDCNFMKMIRMSKSLCKKYNQAVRGAADSRLVFEKLAETADPGKVREWESQERLVHQRCRRDPTAMDIYEVQLQKVPMRKQQEIKLLAEQGRGPGPIRRRGAATWLAEGLTIEEAQVTLQLEIKKVGGQPTDTQRLYIARRGDREARVVFLSDRPGDDEDHAMELDLLILDEESDAEMDDQRNVFKPEKAVIPLPSNLGQDTCTAIGVNALAKQELILRQGQANDALHNIRTVRVAKSQATATRAWAQVHSVDRAVSIQASIYLNLSADDALLQRYQPLAKEHLKVSTTVADPNSRGQRNNTLPWFWSLDVAGDSEIYRVHWLRAKALKDRWVEEILLAQHEMDWTCNFFRYKAEEWKHLGVVAKEAKKEAHMAYAGRQGKIYESLLEEAKRAFHRTKV
ncbi:uncharacterized protein F5891DRAFT_1125607 [Suillus fuscotomentosus]|uniref:CxC2-like cysteine cluster KDZ transposase-associated domain-containing protein n=1 Tax=Suillus fuscotomentosus TaxID=1912939 RepID=A0AAD4EH65_9AGAM|nr:uncharacterized protein F5891DRAFT_1125607 [Suillus fuscotomentosus]KAG1906159.1 hypothetical protein F5891DRAFT_1125607 [Suillus fuscotomentosus]